MVENARKWLEDAWKMGDVQYNIWRFFLLPNSVIQVRQLSLSRHPSETKNKQKQIWKNNLQR